MLHIWFATRHSTATYMHEDSDLESDGNGNTTVFNTIFKGDLYMSVRRVGYTFQKVCTVI